MSCRHQLHLSGFSSCSFLTALEVDTVLLLPRNESRRRCLVFLHACTVITDGSPDLLVLFVEAAAQEPKAHEACRIIYLRDFCL